MEILKYDYFEKAFSKLNIDGANEENIGKYVCQFLKKFILDINGLCKLKCICYFVI